MPQLLKEWVTELPVIVQSTLICGIRGPDGVQQEGTHRLLVRAVRNAVLYPASTENYKNADGPFFACLDVPLFLSVKGNWINQHSYHWVSHILECCQILGYYHPTPEDKAEWGRIYSEFCQQLHLNPETKEQYEKRISKYV